MTTGEIIKILRQQKGITQSEFSEILGVKKSSVQKYESGAVNNLKMEVLRKMLEFFKVPAWVFIFPERVEDLNSVYIDDAYISMPHKYRSLNDRGREKLAEYAKDLIDSGNYERKV